MKKSAVLLSLFLLVMEVYAQFQPCLSPTTRDLYDVFFVDASTGVAVGDSGVIVRSTDGGISWTQVMSDDTVMLKKVKFFDSLHGIALGTDRYTTSDGGQSWVKQYSPDSFYDVEILNDTTCLVSGFPTAVSRSTDRGLSWEVLVGQNINESYGLLSFVNEQMGYSFRAGALSFSILKTLDGGVSWQEITLLSGVGNTVLEAMSFVSEDIGFKGGWYEPHLKKTTNGALDWNDPVYPQALEVPSLYDFHIEANQPNAYYACGWYGTLYRSVDGGNTWLQLPSPVSSTTRLSGIFFVDDSTGWAVGQYGTIIRTTNGGGLTGLDVTDSPTGITCYPNPTHDYLYLSLDAGLVLRQLTLYDRSGRRLADYPPETRLSLGDLPVGIYFLKVVTEQGVFWQKVERE